jgi:hypothetical protein
MKERYNMANKKQVKIDEMVKQLKKAQKFLELVQQLKEEMDKEDDDK